MIKMNISHSLMKAAGHRLQSPHGSKLLWFYFAHLFLMSSRKKGFSSNVQAERAGGLCNACHS